MIITLTQANFSACNIGTLTTYKVKTSSVTGATVVINRENVDKKGYDVNTDIATISLDKENYTGHNIVVIMSGETKEWYKNDKVTIPANTPITSNITISVSATAIVPVVPVEQYTFTINPTPQTATVTLTATGGYTQSGNAITVPSGTVVTWKVSANGFTEQNGTHTVTQNESKSVSLVAVSGDMYTYTVNTTPKVANVTLSAPGYTQSGNAITVPSGTSVSWTVESLGYTKQEGIETITSDKSSNIELTSADETQPVLTVYSTPSGKTIWTPTGGKKVNSNETGTFVGDTVGMRCYWGVIKDGYEPQGDIAQLNSNINREVSLIALPIAEVDHQLNPETEMTKVNGYFITSAGAHNGYYSNFCYWSIPVTPGQRYKIETTTGQNAYPALFCSNSVDLSSTDLTSNPAGNTLPKFTVKSSKKYGGPQTFGQYVVTIPDGVTTMVVNNGTAATATSAFKIYLLK